MELKQDFDLAAVLRWGSIPLVWASDDKGDTLLAFRLPAFEAKLRLRERKHPKLYWVDPGLVRAAGNRYGEPHPQEKGVLFEGLVASLLRACRDYLGLFDGFYYWASATGKNTEVDFLLERENRYLAIEVKASGKLMDSHLKGLRACRNLEGLKRRILVYLGERTMKTADGIDVWPFSRFVEHLDTERLWGP
jgi:predicted AAA+ superfamily ATPase